MRMHAYATALLAGAAAVALSATPASAATSHRSPSPNDSTVDAAFNSMSDGQRVGQLFMAALPAGASTSGLDHLIATHHVGSVILQGHWDGGVSQVHATTSHLRAEVNSSSTRNVGMYIAGDQEGGNIQPFKGAGFSSIFSALLQGQQTAVWEQQHSHLWATQLASAGINLDLAPVADTVPSAAAAANNPPIGQLRREFSFSVRTNDTHVQAFVRGVQSAGVATAVKHFPGLGRVDANTDTATKVVDSTTTPTDLYLQPFKYGALADTRMIMVSLAYYTKIDGSQPAAFSHTVIDGLLRGGAIHYNGVVISDSLGAASASTISPGDQAIRFLVAGGDLMLQTNDGVIPQMQSAVLAQMSHDPGFKALVYASVKRVLTAKEGNGLLPH